MTEFDIIDKLNAAYGMSTRSCNLFLKAINSIDWQDKFDADGETYYIYDNLTVTVQDVDPFKQLRKPSYMLGTIDREFGIGGR